MGMGKPVEVDAEHQGFQFGDELLRIEIPVLQHPEGQVDDPHPDPVPFQVLGDGGRGTAKPSCGNKKETTVCPLRSRQYRGH